MKKKQKRLIGIRGLLIFAVVALIGLVGWYVWQLKYGTPGEMKLPLKKTVIYSNKDGGCHTITNDFGPNTTCLRNTLISYRPSGNLLADETSIAEQFVKQQRGWTSLKEVSLPTVPFSLSVNQLGSGASSTRNAGLCLIIVNRSQTNPKGCASQSDYQALRAAWSNKEADYAIGVIYYTFR